MAKQEQEYVSFPAALDSEDGLRRTTTAWIRPDNWGICGDNALKPTTWLAVVVLVKWSGGRRGLTLSTHPRAWVALLSVVGSSLVSIISNIASPQFQRKATQPCSSHRVVSSHKATSGASSTAFSHQRRPRKSPSERGRRRSRQAMRAVRHDRDAALEDLAD